MPTSKNGQLELYLLLKSRKHITLSVFFIKEIFIHNMQKYPMTINGAKLLQQELEHLKGVERPNVIQAIAEARSHGDLSENAEYDAAKNRQGFIEGRIALLSEKLSHAISLIPAEYIIHIKLCLVHM